MVARSSDACDLRASRGEHSPRLWREALLRRERLTTSRQLTMGSQQTEMHASGQRTALQTEMREREAVQLALTASVGAAERARVKGARWYWQAAQRVARQKQAWRTVARIAAAWRAGGVRAGRRQR